MSAAAAHRESVSIGVFGGSGFYAFLDDVEHVHVETPYGDPSADVAIGTIEGRRVAFLPRHGVKHQFPPHMVNYRANVWAMKELGVERILGPCAVGSLRAVIKPGEFVICDQLVDWTKGRPATFYDGPVTTHVSFADPYCPTLREVSISEGDALGVPMHERGTMVVVQGPRFSTRAESRLFAALGWDVVGMTQHPEAVLARELEICFGNISLVTDYDVGVEGEIEPVTNEEVIRVFQANIERLRALLSRIVGRIPEERNCVCATALAHARFEV